MFTGIVAAVGRIARRGPGALCGAPRRRPGSARRGRRRHRRLDRGQRLLPHRRGLPERGGRRALAFDVSAETLRCTTGLDGAGPVNLEKALRLADRLGGHLVTGHVDGVGTVVALEPVAEGTGWGSHRLVVDAPRELARYVAPKGSIAVQGVSLTVNAVAGTRFEVNLIPHTLDVTTLRELAPGDRVNLEVDLVARYVARLHEFDR